MRDRKEIQSHDYQFPYHYIVDLKKTRFTKNLAWGLDYYNYNTKVIELIKKHIKNDILDIGCGDGFLLNNLKLKNIKAVGIDIDEKAILFAKAFSLNNKNIEFINKDIKHYKKSFKLITCIETLEHISDKEIPDFIKGIDFHLKKEGILIISVPSKNIKLRKKHYRHYTVKMLKAYFPKYQVLETNFISKKKNIFFRLTQFLLCNNKLNLNFSIFRNILLYLNKTFFYRAKQHKAGHTVIVFKK